MTGKEWVFDGYRPGALAKMLALHMDYYGREWGFGKKFETYCAAGMATFFETFSPEKDLFLAAWSGNDVLRGTVVIQGRGDNKAQLRWFVVDPCFQGQGLGRTLLEAAMTFCREKGVDEIFLSTFAGLEASRNLYESAGFKLMEEKTGDPWTGDKGELIFRWKKDR